MTTGYTKTKGARQDRRTGLRLSRGNTAPPAAAHRHRRQPFFQLFLIPKTPRQRPAVPGALGAGRGHGRSREQQHSGPSGTQAEPWPWLPAHACWSSGFALRKGRVLPSRPARHGPSSRSVGAQLLPAHRRLGLCSLGFQNRLARPLKAVNFPKENPVRK